MLETIHWNAAPIELVGKIAQIKKSPYSNEIDAVLLVPNQTTREYDERDPRTYILLNLFDPDMRYITKDMINQWVKVRLEHVGGWIIKEVEDKKFKFNNELTWGGSKKMTARLIITSNAVFLNFKFFRLRLILMEAKWSRGLSFNDFLLKLKKRFKGERYVEVEVALPFVSGSEKVTL